MCPNANFFVRIIRLVRTKPLFLTMVVMRSYYTQPALQAFCSPMRCRDGFLRLDGVLLFVAVVSLGGCMLPPPPPEPQPLLSMEEVWASTMDAYRADDDWIATFRDPLLPALVEETLKYNRNFWPVIDRINEAAMLARHSGVSLLPVTKLSDDAAASDDANDRSNRSNQYHVGLQVSWKPDLWIRLRNEAEERRGQTPTSVLSESILTDINHARQLLVARVAESWFIVVGNKLRLELKRDLLLVKRGMRDSMQIRSREGVVSPTDINRTRLSVAQAQESIMRNQDSLDDAVLSLKVLLGRYPVFMLDEVRGLPPVPDPAAAGLSSELFERRPDIRFANSRIAVTLNQPANAKAAQIPRRPLTDANGEASQLLLDTAHISNPVWSVITGLLVPIKSRDKYGRYLNTTHQQQALEAYAKAAYTAFREAQIVLENEHLLRVQGKSLISEIAVLASLMESRKKQYESNTIDLASLIETQKWYFDARHKLLNIRVEQLKQRINLHLVIGGSFQ